MNNSHDLLKSFFCLRLHTLCTLYHLIFLAEIASLGIILLLSLQDITNQVVVKEMIFFLKIASLAQGCKNLDVLCARFQRKLIKLFQRAQSNLQNRLYGPLDILFRLLLQELCHYFIIAGKLLKH